MQPRLFNFHGQQVRTMIINDDPYFMGRDITNVLQYSNGPKAIRDHVDEEDKTVNETFTVNGTSPVLINESGLYSLILSSKLPTAREFKHWVTSEVLPAIRKTGNYSIRRKPDSYMIEDPVKRAERWIEERKAYEALVPKGQYFDNQMHNPGLMTVTEIAKDYGMSAASFNRLLHHFNIQYKQGNHWVLYQKYANKGYTQYEAYPYDDNKGVHNNLKWTQKGKKFIHDELAKHHIYPILEQMELLPE